MFKKILALLLTVSALLTLCSCGLVDMFKKDEEEETTSTIPFVTEPTTELNTDWYTEPESLWEEESSTEAESAVPVAGTTRKSSGSSRGTAATTKKATGNQKTCDHVWADATCSKPQTCIKCGLTKGNPNKHNYAAATCVKPQTCRNCGATTGAPLGHDYDALGRCKRCDPYYKNQTTTEKPAETTTEKPAETTTEKPAETTTDKPTETTTEKPAESSTDKPADSTTEKPTETTSRQSEEAIEPSSST